MQYLNWFLVISFLICSFGGIILVYVLGRSKVKEIDKIVHGFEIPGDNIFYKLQRIPSYGAAFAWKWGARRSGMEKIRGDFDKEFQRPFIITFWLFAIGIIVMIVAILLDKYANPKF